MNKHTLNILVHTRQNPGITQRELAKALALSPAFINQQLRYMRERGYIAFQGREKHITEAGIARMESFRVKNALILASRPGILFLPKEEYTPKGLIEVRGERMVERQIRQLHARGITDITLLVGYHKEKFEYLIDQYGVKLLLVLDYMERNALSSLYHARALLQNTYITHGDHYIEGNPFQYYDCESWYGDVSVQAPSGEWYVQADARGRMRNIVIGGKNGRILLGPAHFTEEFSQAFLQYLEQSAQDPRYFNSPWETVLLEHLPRLPPFYVRPMQNVYKLSNLESLRAFDPAYRDGLQDAAKGIISRFFHVPEGDIGDMTRLKEGMNNASFLFRLQQQRYMLRIPEPGANDLVDRAREGACYAALQNSGLTDEPLLFDRETGVKLAPAFENARMMDAACPEEQRQYACTLRSLHQSGRVFPHTHDFYRLISRYEQLSLASGTIPYYDYQEVKALTLQLLSAVQAIKRPCVCCHNDAAAVNFLVLQDGSMRMVDWEYGGMGDPLNDIATFAINLYSSPAESKSLLALYLEREPTHEEEALLYAYMAIVGFTWSLWAVYKANLGIDFKEYGIMNYRYAKVFGKYARAMLDGKQDIPEWSIPILY